MMTLDQNFAHMHKELIVLNILKYNFSVYKSRDM